MALLTLLPVVVGIVDVRISAARHNRAGGELASSRLFATRDSVGDCRRCCPAGARSRTPTPSSPLEIPPLTSPPPETFAPGYPQPLERVALGNARLLLDQPELALEVLTPIDACRCAGPAEVVEGKIREALAAQRMHCDAAAMSAISEAVDIAAAAKLDVRNRRQRSTGPGNRT